MYSIVLQFATPEPKFLRGDSDEWSFRAETDLFQQPKRLNKHH